MATAATAPLDQSAEVDAGVNPWLIAAAVMLATFMEVLDTAIASVALPYIAGSLSATNDEATWVLTSYLVANAVVLPASNWFSLKFGRKRFLMTCIAIFTVASFACGAAPTLGLLLLARVVQGAGGGALQPLSQAILLESFPPAKRGAAMAVFAFGVVVAPVLGPTLGGWLTDSYSWRYAFYINIPIGILALFMIGRFIKDPPYISKAKVAPLRSLWLRRSRHLDRRPPGHPGQGSGSRLVRSHVGPLGRRRSRRQLRLLRLALLDRQERPRRPQSLQGSQLPHRLSSHLPLRNRHLLHHYRASALLPGTTRLYGIHRRPGGRTPWHRRHLRHAHHRVPLQQDRPTLPAHLRIPHLRPHHPLLRQRNLRHLAPPRCCCRFSSPGSASPSSSFPSTSPPTAPCPTTRSETAPASST